MPRQLSFMNLGTAARWLVAGMWLCCVGIASAAEDPVQALRNAVNREGAPTPYVLGPNDLIQLNVYGEEDLNVSRRIGSDGRVSFPLIEAVSLGGLTVDKAIKLIHEALAKDYLVDPKVTLTVLEASPRTFNIIGFVKSPGAYPIVGESIGLVAAIALAGGGTPDAKLTKVTVMRMSGGEKKVVLIDAERMIKDPRTASFEVRPGDTIFIPDKVF